MDTISPEFRLEPTGPGGFIWGEWRIDDDHALMMHKPTRAVFSIYLAPGTDLAAPSLYQLCARLAHVCDGHPVSVNIAALGACAINAFACMTDRLQLVETRVSPDDEIPF